MQAFEVEQRAVGVGQGCAGGPFDDLAEQAVAGVGVGVHGARLPDGGAVVHGEAHLLQTGPSLRRVGVHRGLVGRVLADVVDPARVHEHLADGDGVGPITAGAQRVDRLRCKQITDRGVERQPVLLDETQDRGCGERLGVAGDAEPGIGCQRCRRRSVGDAGGDAHVEMSAGRLDVENEAGDARRCTDSLLDHSLQLCRHI